jgi:hypothetical protein
MKKTLILFSVSILLLASCQKEDSVKPLVKSVSEVGTQDTDNSFLRMTSEEYNELYSKLEFEFSQIENVSTNEELIKIQSSILKKFPLLNSHKSLLKLYHKALLLGNGEKEEFVKQNPNHFIYFKELNYIMLNIPLADASIWNEDCIYKIDSSIIQQLAGRTKIIENGDESLISKLPFTNKGNTNITIFDLVNTDKVVTDQNVYTYQSYYQVAWAKYYLYAGSRTLKAGTNAIPFFLGNQTYAAMSVSSNISTFTNKGNKFCSTYVDETYANYIFSQCLMTHDNNSGDFDVYNVTNYSGISILYGNGVNFAFGI